MTELKFHPLANLFPLMEGEELKELVVSVQENGLREAIMVFDGLILDGRNRYRACIEAGVDYRIELFAGKDPVQLVIDKNLRRRHLNESQRGMIAARLATLKVGQHQDVSDAGPIGLATDRVCKMLSISTGTVKRAKTVLAGGTEKEIRAVDEGKIAVGKAADNIRKRTPQLNKKKKDLANTGRNIDRIQNMRIRGEIWGHIKEALIHLTSLPQISDAVAVAHTMDRAGFVDRHLQRATKYLKEFENAWSSKNTNHNNNAGNGHSTAGKEQAESAA